MLMAPFAAGEDSAARVQSLVREHESAKGQVVCELIDLNQNGVGNAENQNSNICEYKSF
jgi:hypothetical protein